MNLEEPEEEFHEDVINHKYIPSDIAWRIVYDDNEKTYTVYILDKAEKRKNRIQSGDSIYIDVGDYKKDYKILMKRTFVRKDIGVRKGQTRDKSFPTEGYLLIRIDASNNKIEYEDIRVNYLIERCIKKNK